MKKQRVNLEDRIDKEKVSFSLFQEEIGKLNIFKSEHEEKINQAKNLATSLKEQLQAKKTLLEETITQKKVLLNLEWRHKTDKVFYDQRQFDLNKELSYLRKQLGIFKKSGHQIGEEEDRTVKIYQKLSKELD